MSVFSTEPVGAAAGGSPRTSASRQANCAVRHPLRFPPSQSCPTAGCHPARHCFPPYHPRYRRPNIGARNRNPAQRRTAMPCAPASLQTIRAIAVQVSVPAIATQPSARPLCRVPQPPTKPSAHKRPVDRPVGLRVCRCRYRRRPLADVPKERAAIQLPETKQPFPERRAAWGWLPAAAFHPANPQPEASAGFLVPFSKKGTSF